jgi:hypothetical protein
MRDYKVIRRMARAALEQAISNAGVPKDYVILPHQDDPKLLWVTGETEVRWMESDNIRERATIYFDEDYVGVVAGKSVYVLSDSEHYYPDDYGLDHRLPFELPFDISDLAVNEMAAWESLPLAKIRRPRAQIPRVHL